MTQSHAQPEDPALQGLYTRPFLLLLGIQLAFGFSFSAFYLLPKFLTLECRASPSEVGVVTAMFGVAGVAAVPVVGATIDRTRRSMQVLAGCVLMSLSAAGYLVVEHPDALACVLRLGQGLAWAIVFTASLALTTASAPPGRIAEAIGLVGGANLLMNAVAPAIAEPLADRLGYGPVFAIAAASAVLGAALSVRIDEPPPDTAVPSLPLAGFFARPAVLAMAPVLTASGLAFGVMFTFHQTFALALGIRQIKGFFIAYTAGALLVRLGLGRVADRVGHRRVAVAALLGYGASVVGMCALTATRLVVFGGLFGVAHGFFFPAFNALILGGARRHEHGKMMTLSNAFFSVGSASVLGLGVVVERFGYPVVFILAGSGALVGSLFVLAWPRLVRS